MIVYAFMIVEYLKEPVLDHYYLHACKQYITVN